MEKNKKLLRGVYESCWIYICMYGKKRKKLCDLSCVGANKPCRNYINVWKISRYRHYRKISPDFPTTLDAWKKKRKVELLNK